MSTKKALTNSEQDSFCPKTELLKRLEDHNRAFTREWAIQGHSSIISITQCSSWGTVDIKFMEENRNLYESYLIVSGRWNELKILIALNPIKD